MCVFVFFPLCYSVTLSTRGKGKKQDYRYVNMLDMCIFILSGFMLLDLCLSQIWLH